MPEWKIALLSTVGLLSLLVIVGLLTLPHYRLTQVAKYLRATLEDPERELKVPRTLRGVGSELSAVRARLLLQQSELKREAQRQQELIAFLAHDLKTPLTSVLGYLELLWDEPGLTEEQRVKYTGIALNKARRLEELVGEFFDINTMELALTKRESVQLSFLLEQLADEFYPLFASRSLTCQPEVEPDLVVEGDGDRLARVFDNVLRNAVSYSAPGGPVLLSARREGKSAVVTIANDGLEIPEKELTNIFQKFYRLDAARSTRTGGAGLGLAIAKEIVELHGGDIRAESTGERTAFVITLPLQAGK
ncbi:sensor histidine kinase [Vermiculatibacterium agrestimuris]|uniref:sensor histidine kinase n=1 Tax=Vermiculatibacterium agrestimuris TaxID=2941519 RepID=UPI0020412BA4|nr:HAMP domain-containing sensor histidine kinase [Vermiculatibacterium agrestimuris]